MKKRNSLFIIIFSTFVSLINMAYWQEYKMDLNKFEQTKLLQNGVEIYNKDYIQKNVGNNENQIEVVGKGGDGILSTKDSLETDNLSQKNINNDYKNVDKIDSANSNVNSSKEDVITDNKSKDSLEKYYDYIENEQSVFKVSTRKIKDSLTTTDKIKLLYASMQLDKESYKKVKEYLYAVDAEDGVLKALDLLKENLSEKEYEKIREIAEKFIDMDAAEGLK